MAFNQVRRTPVGRELPGAGGYAAAAGLEGFEAWGKGDEYVNWLVWVVNTALAYSTFFP